MAHKIYIGKNNWNHDKNKNGLELFVKDGLLEKTEVIADADIVLYTSACPTSSDSVDDIDIYDKRYKDKLILLGPHFSVFPTPFIRSLDNTVNGNITFNLLSKWICNIWQTDLGKDHTLRLVNMPFPVDTERFKPMDCEKDCVIIYVKRRRQADYQFIIDHMKSNGYNVKVFNYTERYNEMDYIDALHRASFGIWIGCHESQGFALQEALACGVPLLVFDVKYMNQETGQERTPSYVGQNCTTIPYWDERCGESFQVGQEFLGKLAIITNKLSSYKPREFILENVSIHGAFKKYWEHVIKSIQQGT